MSLPMNVDWAGVSTYRVTPGNNGFWLGAAQQNGGDPGSVKFNPLSMDDLLAKLRAAEKVPPVLQKPRDPCCVGGPRLREKPLVDPEEEVGEECEDPEVVGQRKGSCCRTTDAAGFHSLKCGICKPVTNPITCVGPRSEDVEPWQPTENPGIQLRPNGALTFVTEMEKPLAPTKDYNFEELLGMTADWKDCTGDRRRAYCDPAYKNLDCKVPFVFTDIPTLPREVVRSVPVLSKLANSGAHTGPALESICAIPSVACGDWQPSRHLPRDSVELQIRLTEEQQDGCVGGKRDVSSQLVWRSCPSKERRPNKNVIDGQYVPTVYFDRDAKTRKSMVKKPPISCRQMFAAN